SKKEYGALRIYKTIKGTPASIKAMDGSVKFLVTAEDGTEYGPKYLKDFEEKVTMPDGTAVRVWTISNLEAGRYTITEQRDDDESGISSSIEFNAEAYGIEGTSASVDVVANGVAEIRPSNVYNEAAAWERLRVQKLVEGSVENARYDRDETFTFRIGKVKEPDPAPSELDDGTLVPASTLPTDPTITARAGEVGESAYIYFNQTGSYYYSITEQEPASPTHGMTYDTTPRYARVDVVRDEAGSDKAYVAYGTDLAALEAMSADQVVAASAAEGGGNATVTNRYELGNLKINKEIVGPTDADDQDFDVVVTSNETGRFVALDGTLSDEEQVLTVSKNTPLEIHDVPVGSYTVTELESNRGVDLYAFNEGASTTTGEASVPLNDTATFTLTNAYERNTASKQLKVRKVVKAAKGTKYAGSEDFTFELRAVTEGAPMPEGDTATAKAGGTARFGNITFDKVGEYLYSITEVAGETLGMTYDVKPHYALVTVDEVDGKLVADVTYGKTQDTADKDASLTVTNKFNAVADLQVKKTVVSTRTSDKNQDYEFKVTTYKNDKKTVNKDVDGTYGDITFESGVAKKVTLKHGQTKTAKGLPALDEDGKECYYKVEETQAHGLVPNITRKTTSTGALFTCTNTYKPTTPNRTTPGTSSSSSYNRTSTPKTADATPQAMVLALGIAGALGIVASQLRRRREAE
ncbi:MAG: FctA domain-containing protein, partial [Coriobacteriaceae bacterium]|nr:FctA domain-containing protein [Coriobacteriaceae bacterium]